MHLFTRQSPIERTVDTMQRDVARLADLAADEVRARVKAEAGRQIADSLERLGSRVEHADLARQVRRGEKRVKRMVKNANREMERFADRVSETMEQSSAQLAHLGEEGAAQVREVWPEKNDRHWVGPTLLGFLFGFAMGFFVGRSRS